MSISRVIWPNQSLWNEPKRMSAERIILIVVLLFVGAHLMLFGWLWRRIAEARRAQEQSQRGD